MDPTELEALIEDGVEESEATVSRPRDPDDDSHLAAVVVSPAFEGVSLVDRHSMVYDALGDRMTRDVHALELRTFTPEEYAERED